MCARPLHLPQVLALSAIKLAVADPNADLLRGDMIADEMREIIGAN